MFEAEEEFFVLTKHGRVEARLLHDRPRSRIWVLPDGQYVKTVKHSQSVIKDPTSDPDLAGWLARSRRSWFYLKRHAHPGLLVVGDRVYDSFGDEGYLCQGLQVFALKHPDHPARKSLRAFLQCAIQLSRAVGVMHEAGFVHGDITPGNVCFHNGLPVLIDYEMTVKVGQIVGPHPGDKHHRVISCTPECCSPEHVYRRQVQPSSDIFCIGLTLLSWLSERFGVGETYWHQNKDQSMGLCARAEYPHWEVVKARLDHPLVVDVLARAIRLAPHERYVNGNHFADALEALFQVLSPQELDHPLDAPLESFSSSAEYDNLTIYLELTP